MKIFDKQRLKALMFSRPLRVNDKEVFDLIRWSDAIITSTGRIPIAEAIEIYERRNQGFSNGFRGFPTLVNALKHSRYKQVKIHSLVESGSHLIVFTDVRVSEVIGAIFRMEEEQV